jgi:hypothetical protein
MLVNTRDYIDPNKIFFSSWQDSLAQLACPISCMSFQVRVWKLEILEDIPFGLSWLHALVGAWGDFMDSENI